LGPGLASSKGDLVRGNLGLEGGRDLKRWGTRTKLQSWGIKGGKKGVFAANSGRGGVADFLGRLSGRIEDDRDRKVEGCKIVRGEKKRSLRCSDQKRTGRGGD